MVTKQQFIEQEIVPTLGDYADCYDMDAIADEVSDFDPCDGYVWKPEYETGTAYWNVVAKHSRKG